jgi:predicted alpha/beta superfamily hydrolase
MPERQPRLLRENNPDFPSFVLGGSHIRDIPQVGNEPADQVLVALPWSYNEEPKRTYPVVYLCDGFWDFPLVWGMYSHLLDDKVVLEYILVGLAYGGERPDV